MATVTRQQFLIGSALAVALIAGASAAGLELASAPPYKQPWCASVIQTLGNKHQNQGQFEAALASEGAPVSKLLSDVQAYDQAQAGVQSSNGFGTFGAQLASAGGQLASALGTVNVIGSDLRQIDLECGLPASAADHQGI